MAKFEGRRYVGDGRYVQGVPARDLDGEEWGALDPALREQAEGLGLYEIARDVRKTNETVAPKRAPQRDITAEDVAADEGVD